MNNFNSSEEPLAEENARLRREIERLEATIHSLNRSSSDRQAADFHAWAEMAPIGVFLLSDGRFIYVNTALAELIGMKGDDLLTEPCWELGHPDDVELLKHRYAERRAGREVPMIVVTRILKPDGRVLWIQTYESAYRYHDRDAILGFVIDVTYLIESEKRLAAEEEKYRTLVEAATEAIFTVDRQGVFLFMNAEAARQLNGLPAEFIGRTQWDVFPQALADRQMQAIRAVFDTGEGFSREVPTVMPKSPRFHHTTGVPIRNLDGQVAAVLCIARDVTDLMLARKALSESEAKYSRLLENLPVGVIQLSPVLRVIGGNPALARMYGYDSIEECLGIPAGDSFTNQAKAEEIRQGLTEKGFLRDFEFENRRKDGSTFWTSLNARVQYDADGKPASIDGIEIDITERKIAEDALRLSEAKYRDLFENAQVGMFQSTLDGSRVLAVNQRVADIVGYTVDEILTMASKIAWRGPSERSDLVRRLREQGSIRDYEVTIRTRAGELRHLLLSARLYVERGVIEGSVLDITERLLAEEALAESEQLFRAVAEAAPAVIVIMQGDKIVFANQLAVKALGMESSDLEKINFWDFMAPEFRDKVRETGLARQRGEKVPDSYEVQVVTAQGETRWAYLSGKQIVYKGKPAALGIGVDITERKLMEEQLRESEERFRRIIHRSFDTIVNTDTEGVIVYASPAVEKLAGSTPEQIIGRHVSEFVPQTHLAAIGKALAAVALGRAVEGVQYEFVAADGRSISVESNITPMVKDGRVVGAQAIMRDISARKQAEKMLEEAHYEQSRQLRQVAGGLAHDIYNDLYPITTSLYKLRQRFEASPDPDKSRDLRLLQLSENAINRAVRLTESVSLYSRLQRDKMGSCADLKATLTAMLEHNRDRINGTGVRVDVNVPEQLQVGCAQTQLHSLLNNLLLNALDALEESTEPTIRVSAKLVGEQVALEFWDSGDGIPAEILPRIFEPFFSTKPNTGTGLGLAIVKRIVDICGGTITVKSDLDTGTTFFILLPTDVGTSYRTLP